MIRQTVSTDDLLGMLHVHSPNDNVNLEHEQSATRQEGSIYHGKPIYQDFNMNAIRRGELV